MIVAGVGSRKGVSTEAVLAAIRAAAGAHGLPVARIGRLATGEIKSGEAAFAQAALELGVPLEFVSTAKTQSQTTLSRSLASLVRTGAGSLAEAAALASAGEGARLFGPRTVFGPVTCALAESRL